MTTTRAVARNMLEQEARALLSRLARITPFALHETMVPAAGISPSAQVAIERFLITGRREMRRRTKDFLGWLRGPGRNATPEEMQRQFVFVRMRFNDVLSQFDLFNDSITQRSEHETGVYLSGLDVVAADAMRLPGAYYDPPPVVCHLDRGPGAAIRRARTRLPGGGENPVASIRVPRERMVGHGIASSLFHEVGHQVAALLDLITSLRIELQKKQRVASDPHAAIAWTLYERWISEIVADFWSVSRAGLSSTMGLMGVVSLPRWFVFRINTQDPHPTPWIRVMLSATIGSALYPHPQWKELAAVWQQMYPTKGLDAQRARVMTALGQYMGQFVQLLLAHRAPTLRGKTLREIGYQRDRTPQQLDRLQRAWGNDPKRMGTFPPSLVFAVIGQARARGNLTPESEATILRRLLTYWALRSSLDTSATIVAGRRMPTKRIPARNVPAHPVPSRMASLV